MSCRSQALLITGWVHPYLYKNCVVSCQTSSIFFSFTRAIISLLLVKRFVTSLKAGDSAKAALKSFQAFKNSTFIYNYTFSDLS